MSNCIPLPPSWQDDLDKQAATADFAGDEGDEDTDESESGPGEELRDSDVFHHLLGEEDEYYG